jgi:peptide-N4-(N-acetyl-beta-glucosaminyl)asparagine amidase
VRDLVEQVQLLDAASGPAAAGSGASEALPGRTTGSVEWRLARGEGGASGPASGPAPAGTPYRRAAAAATLGPPAAAWAAFGRLGPGCAARASGENGPQETAERALDGGSPTHA